MHYLGVIPARGGSKGIPRKNLAPVGGVSLVGRAIRSGRDAARLSHLLVSTDDQEIADEAARHDLPAPFLRPAALAADDTPTHPVLRHAVDWYEGETGTTVEAVVTLQPTAPFRTGADIDAAIAEFEKHSPGADARHNRRAMYVADGGRLKPLFPNADPVAPRQRIEKVYLRNGAVYVTSRDLLMRGNAVVTAAPLYYEMPALRSVNVDDPADLEYAGFLAGRLDKENF